VSTIKLVKKHKPIPNYMKPNEAWLNREGIFNNQESNLASQQQATEDIKKSSVVSRAPHNLSTNKRLSKIL